MKSNVIIIISIKMKKTYKQPLVEVANIATEQILCAASIEGQLQSDETITEQTQILSKGNDYDLWEEEE